MEVNGSQTPSSRKTVREQMAMTMELRLTEIQGRGRSLVAAQPLKGGQIVLRDSPLLLYSALPFLTPSPPPYCDHCFKTLNPQNAAVSLCPSCSHHAFCSPNCLSAAQPSSHTPWVCQSLSKLRNCHSPLSCQSVDRQVQARFLIAAYNLAVVSPSNFQLLMSLSGQPQDSDDARFLHSLISTLCPPPQQQPFSVEFTAALLAKDKQNAFGLMEPPSEFGLRSSRAYGIYPNASFFNHDCLPNACRFDYVDEGSCDIIVRMIHDVPEGREICLSYFPVNQAYSSWLRTMALCVIVIGARLKQIGLIMRRLRRRVVRLRGWMRTKTRKWRENRNQKRVTLEWKLKEKLIFHMHISL